MTTDAAEQLEQRDREAHVRSVNEESRRAGQKICEPASTNPTRSQRSFSSGETEMSLQQFSGFGKQVRPFAVVGDAVG